MKTKHYVLTIRDDDKIEIGLYKLSEFLRGLGFKRGDLVDVAVKNGYFSLTKISMPIEHTYPEPKLAALLYGFAEEVLKTKDAYGLDQLVERTLNEERRTNCRL